MKLRIYIVHSVHSAYIGMRCMWCYKIQTMSMQVGITLTYCIMYCTLCLGISLVRYCLLSKHLPYFPPIYHKHHMFLLQRVKCVQVLCPAPVWSLDVGRHECHAISCRRWTHWGHQVLVASVWRKSPPEDKRLLYHATRGSPLWSLSGGMLPHWWSTHGPTGQGQGARGSRGLCWFQSTRFKCVMHKCVLVCAACCLLFHSLLAGFD